MARAKHSLITKRSEVIHIEKNMETLDEDKIIGSPKSLKKRQVEEKLIDREMH